MSHLLLDLNQIIISNLMMHLKMVAKSKEVNENLIRHMSLNSLRSLVKQFKSKYPNIVLCCDNRKYWRKEFFPFYKANRKYDRDASGFDWHLIFETINSLRTDLKENFPYKVIDVEGSEADDCIAVITKHIVQQKGQVLIISGDKDFIQLQKYPGVTQYSPILKRFIRSENPSEFIQEHIIRGDRGDGIPNIMSPDNCFVSGGRQKKLSNKILSEWITKKPEDYCNELMLRGYKRNQTLIDFDYIPASIENSILNTFNEAKPATKMKMLDYLASKGLDVLFESADDF